MTGVKSFNFNEDDDDYVPFYTLLAYPFSTRIINPSCLRYRDYRKKRIFHNSYHKLAYLHPNNFKPDTNILKKYNLKPNRYIIVRKSALRAHHDIGAKGINEKIWNEILNAIKDYPQIISKEDSKTHDIELWDMHHVLNFAKMLISDSQTMSIEAAILGVPSIRYSTFVGKSSVLDEIENKYGLTYGFQPGKINEEKKMVLKIKELLNIDNIKDIWQEKRNKLLSDKEDLNQWMINFFNKIIKSKIY